MPRRVLNLELNPGERFKEQIVSEQMMSHMASLYDRLGGLDAISAVVDSAVARIAGCVRADRPLGRESTISRSDQPHSANLAMAPHRLQRAWPAFSGSSITTWFTQYSCSSWTLQIQPQALEKSTIRRGVPKNVRTGC